MSAVRVLVPVLVVSLTACSDPASDSANPGQNTGGGPGGGSGGSAGAPSGSGGDPGEGGGLRFDASVFHSNFPTDGNGNVTGRVTVYDGEGGPVTDAVVSVNGVELSLHPFGIEDYVVEDVPSVEAGASVTVTASRGGRSTSLTFQCPEEVTIVSPEADTPVSAGQMITVGISRGFSVDPPMVTTCPWDPKDNLTRICGSPLLGTGAWFDVDQTTSPEFEVTDDFAFDESWLVHLFVSGASVVEGESSGECSLTRRVPLTRAD